MQHSNDNRKESVVNGKQRALQEAARITVSAYIMNFFYTWWSKFINSSLLGAFATTAITSNLNEIGARSVVGIPVSLKSQEELNEISDKIQKSNNPARKVLSYLIGKRCKLHKKPDNTNQSAKANEEIQKQSDKTTFSSLDKTAFNNYELKAQPELFIQKYIKQVKLQNS